MAGIKEDSKKYYTSKETKKLFKISDCKLAHLRIEGKLEFRKIGNRFMYLIEKSKNC
jgi:hypothetical protein